VIVVSDTSPLTALLTVGRASLLQDLFESVRIPRAVQEELLRHHQTLPSYFVVADARDRTHVRELERTLDIGEAEAIVLARELRADLLLVDEKLGRQAALKEGLRVIGLAGVLILAKRKGLIDSVADLLGQIEEQAGFHLSGPVKVQVLRQAGEA
jgi:predicted nucleic acid-binding protein